jgi:hypothetical protein
MTAFWAGLSVLLFILAALNSVLPIRGIVLFCSLLPALWTVVEKTSRRGLISDLGQLACNAESLRLTATGALMMAVLLGPFLWNPRLVFFDGSGNHDNFIWATLGDYLKTRPYLEPNHPDAPHPWLDLSINILGWTPNWGRMGAEGLLAFFSSLRGGPVALVYNAMVVALYVPWMAAVLWVLKLFFEPKPRFWVLLAAVVFQPVFVFFHANGNLPNLLGTLMGTGWVVAVHRLFYNRAPDKMERNSWILLALLFGQGMLCCYPEAAPFLLVSGFMPVLGLGWISRPGTALWGVLRLAVLTLAATFLNPVTGVRAIHGFLNSFGTAHANVSWGQHYLFENLAPGGFALALTSLSVKGLEALPAFISGMLALGVMALFVWGFLRSEQRGNIAALFSGSLLLLAYSFYSHFGYGFQKTVQFAGVFWGTAFPTGCLAWICYGKLLRPAATRMACLFLVLVYGYLTFMAVFRTYVTSIKKRVTVDMMALRENPEAPTSVLILGETFPQNAFFYEMWSSYLLPHSALVYSPRTPMPGAYLVDKVRLENPRSPEKPAAYLVSSEWAKTWDANAPRWKSTEHFVLVTQSNRLLESHGLSPTEMPPRFVEPDAELQLLPHRDSRLHLTLEPKVRGSHSPGAVTLRNEVPGKPAWEITLPEGVPWTLVIPLTGGLANTIHLKLPMACEITSVQITDP